MHVLVTARSLPEPPQRGRKVASEVILTDDALIGITPYDSMRLRRESQDMLQGVRYGRRRCGINEKPGCTGRNLIDKTTYL